MISGCASVPRFGALSNRRGIVIVYYGDRRGLRRHSTVPENKSGFFLKQLIANVCRLLFWYRLPTMVQVQ